MLIILTVNSRGEQMDFDPGELYDEYEDDMSELYDEDDVYDSYEEGYEDGQNDVPEYNDQTEEISERDDDGFDPTDLAIAAGFGHHMAQDEMEDHKTPRGPKGGKAGPESVPLWERHNRKGKMTPFGRWATMVNEDPSKRNEEIQYTKEERLAILKAEGE